MTFQLRWIWLESRVHPSPFAMVVSIWFLKIILLSKITHKSVVKLTRSRVKGPIVYANRMELNLKYLVNW
jgi:hypothetical protein